MDHQISAVIGLHLFTALSALGLGIAVLSMTKGTARHRFLGRVWVGLMLAVAISSFWIQELRAGQGFSPIHLLSIWTLISLAVAIWAIRTGRRRVHRNFMIGTFIGVVAAGAFTMLPGRIVGTFLFG